MGRPRRRLEFKYPVFLGREPLRISKRLSKGDAYKPGFVPVDTGDDHLSVRAIAGGIERPTRTPTGQAARALSCGVLLGLAPDGACRADSVARTAVSSCLAISPLPALRRAVSFCCAIRRISAPGRYPASCLAVPGLSSLAFARAAIRRPFRKVSKNLVYW